MDSGSAVVLDVSAATRLMMPSISDSEHDSHTPGQPPPPPYTPDASRQSPRLLPKGTLTLVQMLLLNAVVCGVEIVACAGFTYIPPMLLKAGYSEENMGFLLGLGPLFGFIFVPVIGRASDRCYSPFGRRRPFILGLSMLLVVSLYLIPFGEYFASLAVGIGTSAHRAGVWALTVGVVLLDFTTQACLTPCEALLNDAAKDSDQNEKIFTVYSLMISMGGILGYLLTAIDWTSTSVGGYFGGQEASIFSILIIVFTLMLSATLLVAQEKPLSLPPAYDVATLGVSDAAASSSSTTVALLNSQTPTTTSSASSLNSSNGEKKYALPDSREANLSNGGILQLQPLESGYESSSEDTNGSLLDSNSFDTKDPLDPRTKSGRNHSEDVAVRKRTPRGGAPRIIPRCLRRLFRRVPCCPSASSERGVLSGLMRLGRWLLPRQLVELFQVPVVLRLLAVADFCSWTAIMGFNIYFTDYVGQVVYGGNPNAAESSPEGRAYDDGVRNASWGLLLHCICSAALSFFVERLTRVYGYKSTFTLGMVTFVFRYYPYHEHGV
ncbi:hypothetical protein EGW08_016102 [Elysia chlorotica]|uniref:Major facilitator superfamily (MFS) profile domain-containing protein n=1 Tax=Elysia chlorotica TaxID=188477 RepID=A0A433T3K6_ELYCH|nr:hypothetical protein EGW08_016102 [Elysia chlorotica]